MLIAVLNQSSVLTNDDLKNMIKAVQKQMVLHVCPAWNCIPPTISFFEDAKSVPGYAWLVRMMDNAEDALSLGYSYKMDNRINGFVFCKPILDNGGVFFRDDYKTSVSSMLSHEIIELFVDRFANLWANGLSSEFGSQYAFEACDPVENDSYAIVIDDIEYSVSNFVFPSWFNIDADNRNKPFDFLKICSFPFKMNEGGMMITRGGPSGTVNYVYSKDYPDWKKQLKVKLGRRNS